MNGAKGVFYPAATSGDRPSNKDTSDANKEYFLKEFPHEAEGIEEMFKDMKICGDAAFIYRIWQALPPFWCNLLKPIFGRKHPNLSKTIQQRLDELFTDQRLKSALAVIPLGDAGVLPSEGEWGCLCGLLCHFKKGASYPSGGPQELVKGMVNTIQENGGRVEEKN